MWPQQETIDKLGTIIQNLQANRETGRLTVIHGDGVTAEEGFVAFANGKIVEARVGRRTGSDAFNRLSSWTNCSYHFVRPTDKPGRSNLHTILNSTSEQFTPVPAHALPSTTRHLPQSGIDPFEGKTIEKHAHIPPVSAVPYPITHLQIAFYKIGQLKLSRSHRHLFLLIDGQRSISDLARLTGKREEEVKILVRDLEYASIITLDSTKNV